MACRIQYYCNNSATFLSLTIIIMNTNGTCVVLKYFRGSFLFISMHVHIYYTTIRDNGQSPDYRGVLISEVLHRDAPLHSLAVLLNTYVVPSIDVRSIFTTYIHAQL